MVSLNCSRRALERDTLNNVWVQSTLKEPFDLSAGVLGFGLDLCGLFFEDVDEGVADKLALLFWVCDALEAVKESLRGVNDSKVDAQVLAEPLMDIFRFIQSQTAIVNEDGMESVANGLPHQLRGTEYQLVQV